MDRPFFKTYWPGLAWFFIMGVLLFMPGTDVPEPETWLKKIFFDKWVHAGLFGTLAALIMYAQRSNAKNFKQIRTRLILTALCIIGWGLATEYIQRDYCISRGFDLWDWGADILGILIVLTYQLYAAYRLTAKNPH